LTSVTVFIGRNISNKGVISSQLWPWNSIWREANEILQALKHVYLKRSHIFFQACLNTQKIQQ